MSLYDKIERTQLVIKFCEERKNNRYYDGYQAFDAVIAFCEGMMEMDLKLNKEVNNESV